MGMRIHFLKRFPSIFSRQATPFQTNRNAKWHVKDFIDLEYFLKQDAEEKPKPASPASVSPDREWYLSYVKNHTPPFSRREIIHFWLTGRREAALKASGENLRLPGKEFAKAFRLALGLVIFTALISGVSLSWSILSYQGQDPINIFTCLWILLVPQTLLLIFLCVMVLLRRLRLVNPAQGAYPMLTSLIRRTMVRLKTTGESALPADQQARVHSLYGILGQQSALYGSIFLWPIFILAQTLMAFFNIGMILAALLKLTITDLAFGWQSTLHPDPAAVHRIMEFISAPWSWLPSALPTVEQIEGSKIILKEGMAHLSTSNLVSWWPFLIFSLLFYGLMPRLILLAYGLRQQARAINRIDFSSSDCDRLIQRMQTPVMGTEGRRYITRQAPAAPLLPDDTLAPNDLNARESMGQAIVLVPEDIDDRCSDYDLEDRISAVLGLDIFVRIRSGMTPASDMAEVEKILADRGEDKPSIRIIFIQEAWQPPIRETMIWLRALRQSVGKHTGIIVGLIGKPIHGMMFTSPDNTDHVIWEQAVNRLADPFTHVENLGG
ncbi:MAG: DUF2868 domain-containing protein [Desulfobacteraceae bacterium]|nr:MAG: DUF2868 domain-containing protein [Desulfobacteraceae bacterium]